MPQPVDLHTEVARVFATERIQQVADRASLAAQQRVADTAQKDQVNHETLVAETQETQPQQVEADQRRQQEQQRARRQKLPGDEDEAVTTQGVDGEGVRLDVSV